MTRQQRPTRPSSSLLEGEGDIRAYNLTNLDRRQDELVDLVRLLLRSRGTANTETIQKNAQSARKRKELLELIDAINSRTQLRRMLQTAELRTEHNRGARQREREGNKPKRNSDEERPNPFVPSLPGNDKPPAQPPTNQPDLPPIFIPDWPDRTRIDRPESDDVYPTDSEPPQEPVPRLRPRDEDVPDCETVATFLRSLGLPAPVCDARHSKHTTIRGGRNP